MTDDYRAVLERLGLPKYPISMVLRMKAGELATVNCTYHPTDEQGNLLTPSNEGELFAALAEEFVMIRRSDFNALPEWVQDKLRVK